MRETRIHASEYFLAPLYTHDSKLSISIYPHTYTNTHPHPLSPIHTHTHAHTQLEQSYLYVCFLLCAGKVFARHIHTVSEYITFHAALTLPAALNF